MKNGVTSIVDRGGKLVAVTHNPVHEDRVWERDEAGGLRFTEPVEHAIDSIVHGERIGTYDDIIPTGRPYTDDDRVFEAQLL